LFEHFRNSEASCVALGYTPRQHHAVMQTNALFFAHYAEARLPFLRGPQPLNDIEILSWIFLPRFLDFSS
jgi:hypothetical protein